MILVVFYRSLRKDVRVVEGVDLERLYGRNIIEGSNPSLSDECSFSLRKTLFISFFFLLDL